MKYLKHFEQASAYEAYKNGSDYFLPNVSYVKDENVVYYNPTSGVSDLEPLPDLSTNLSSDNYYVDVANWIRQECEKLMAEYNIPSNFTILKDGNISAYRNGESVQIDIKHKALFKYLYSIVIDEYTTDFDFIKIDSILMHFQKGSFGATMYWDDGYLYIEVDM